MAIKPFKANKARVVRKQDPVIVGTQMRSNIGIRNWYNQELNKMVDQMMAAARAEIGKALKEPDMKKFFAEDAKKPQSIMARAMEAIKKRFQAITETSLAQQFVQRSDKSSKAAVTTSVGSMGAQYKDKMTGDLNTVIQGSIYENTRLISSLSDEAYNRIEMAVNQSLVSPEAGAQGQKGIYDHLMKTEEMSKSRAKLIAHDQTSKVYTTLNTARMKDAGLQKFRWVHSSARKVPRHSHLDRDGKIYLLKGANSELFNEDGSDANAGVPDGDKGKPGYAINCGCAMEAVIDLDLD